jgi:hypothetical protein
VNRYSKLFVRNIRDVLALKVADQLRLTREVDALKIVIPMLVEDEDVIHPNAGKLAPDNDILPTAEETQTAKPPDKKGFL